MRQNCAACPAGGIPLPIRSTKWPTISGVALSLWARETTDGIFLPGLRDFLLAPKFTPFFFKQYQGWNEAKMIMQAKVFSAMGVWTTLEPQLTTPTTSPSLQGRRGAQSSRPV